jgi:hypothetical protein
MFLIYSHLRYLPDFVKLQKIGYIYSFATAHFTSIDEPIFPVIFVCGAG